MDIGVLDLPNNKPKIPFFFLGVLSLLPLRMCIQEANAICPLNKKPDPKIVKRLLEIGKPLPKYLVLAAACNESAIIPNPGKGDGGKAVGMFQFHPWAKKYIKKYSKKQLKDPRLDWEASALYYVSHNIRQLPRVRKYCKGKGKYTTRSLYLFASANKTAIRFPKCLKRNQNNKCIKRVPRCSYKGGETKHWKMMVRIKNDMEKHKP